MPTTAVTEFGTLPFWDFAVTGTKRIGTITYVYGYLNIVASRTGFSLNRFFLGGQFLLANKLGWLLCCSSLLDLFTITDGFWVTMTPQIKPSLITSSQSRHGFQ